MGGLHTLLLINWPLVSGYSGSWGAFCHCEEVAVVESDKSDCMDHPLGQ